MKEEGKNYRLTMYPDYGECLFWDESGAMCGTTRSVFVYDDEDEFEVDLSSIDGLSEWYGKWEYSMDIMYGYYVWFYKVWTANETGTAEINGQARIGFCQGY